MQASVARCLRTPPEAAKPQDLSFGLLAALRGEGHRSTVVIGNCTVWTDNGGTSPSESLHLYTSVDPISAPRSLQDGPRNGGEVGGAAGYRPRVRSAYYVRVYRHSPRGDEVNIGYVAELRKGAGAEIAGVSLALWMPAYRSP